MRKLASSDVSHKLPLLGDHRQSWVARWYRDSKAGSDYCIIRDVKRLIMECWLVASWPNHSHNVWQTRSKLCSSGVGPACTPCSKMNLISGLLFKRDRTLGVWAKISAAVNGVTFTQRKNRQSLFPPPIYLCEIHWWVCYGIYTLRRV